MNIENITSVEIMKLVNKYRDVISADQIRNVSDRDLIANTDLTRIRLDGDTYVIVCDRKRYSHAGYTCNDCIFNSIKNHRFECLFVNSSSPFCKKDRFKKEKDAIEFLEEIHLYFKIIRGLE